MKCYSYIDADVEFSYEVSTQTFIDSSSPWGLEKVRRNVSLRKFFAILKRYGIDKHSFAVSRGKAIYSNLPF